MTRPDLSPRSGLDVKSGPVGAAPSPPANPASTPAALARLSPDIDHPSHGSLWRSGERRLREAGLDDARLQAEVLLRHAAGLDRAGLLRDLNLPISPEVTARYGELIERATSGEPLAYIVGRREFYGLDLLTDRRALIPRPETELLVELGLARWQALAAAVGTAPLVVDVGTGTGAIALALARSLPAASVVATDRSLDALDLARTNSRRLDLMERVRFVAADLLGGLRVRPHLTLANLPYVPDGRIAALDPWIRAWEPRLALAGGPDGLDLYRRLVREWVGLPSPPRPPPAVRVPGRRDGRGGEPVCHLLFEIGSDQMEAAVALVRQIDPALRAEVHADLSGAPRVVEVVGPGAAVMDEGSARGAG